MAGDGDDDEQVQIEFNKIDAAGKRNLHCCYYSRR
jgi:hypothetical protein